MDKLVHGVVTIGLLALGFEPLWAQSEPGVSPMPSTTLTRAVLDRYCVTCHNERLMTGGLALDSLDLQQVGAHAEVLEKVVSKLRARDMPPVGRPRPSDDQYDATVGELESALDVAGMDLPPGRIPVHRLNRVEYAAAIRDLVGIDVDGRELLPGDETAAEGFENVASVLTVSRALLEDYLAAARRISRVAIGDPTLRPTVETFSIPKTFFQDEWRMSDDLPFGSQGGVSISYYFPVDAEYSVKVLLRRQHYDYIMGLGEPQQIEIRLDGKLLERFEVGGEAWDMTMPESFAGNTQGDPGFEEYMHTADAHLEARTHVPAGNHTVGVSFVRRIRESEGVLQPRITGFGRATNELYHGYPSVEFVHIGGPFGTPRPGESPSRQKIFVCVPDAAAAEEPCAQKILSTLATRAYRRPVASWEMETLLEFYREGRAEGNFDAGIRRGLERILVAPSFLFRIAREPVDHPAGTVYALSDMDLASRLSFFLWSSLPDEALLEVAARGDLRDPEVLERQVLRMLGDQRADALVRNFAHRWLELNKLIGLAPDALAFPEFDENLRYAMERETTLFVGSQLRDDRSVTELLTSDYTFLNERLATHYGIPNIYGNHFRQVALEDGLRGGLLGQASILSLTSYPTRTSVVLRGRWLLANLLGSPPPPPPPNVPSLEEAGSDGQSHSLRERMERHRASPACATCHERMDPLGFALEHYDGLGKWRAAVEGVPVDASAVLSNGTAFEGLSGLRGLLVNREEDFVRSFTEKLLGYALGRGIEFTDRPTIRQIVRAAEPHDYRWSSIVLGIVQSTPFQNGVSSMEPSAVVAEHHEAEGVNASRRLKQ